MTTAELIRNHLKRKAAALDRKTFTFRTRDITENDSERRSVSQWLGRESQSIVFNEFKLT